MSGRTGTDQRSKSNYRADIDGLRTIAVLSVIAYHLDFVFVGGGYIGVDIFFVISGFLIGRSILRERRENKFSLLNFYSKRIRRILPALLFMLFVVTVASAYILLPSTFEEYARTVISAVLSISNIHFWLETDYFAAAAHTKPLLHTWSLGVEEQFYVLFPLILLLTHRLKSFDLPLLMLLATLSFAISVSITKIHPSTNFYLIGTRAWEFILGVFAAELHFGFLKRKRVLREIISLVALGVLALVFLVYTPRTAFPGLSALPPTLATAALLVVGGQGDSLVKRLLSLKPVVWIGLISYSLYLWHWPVIVLLKQWDAIAWLRMPDRMLALLIMFPLAYLSWLLVERPFRSKSMSNSKVYWINGLGSVGLIIIASVIIFTKGLPQRLPENVTATAKWLNDSSNNKECIIGLYAPLGSYVDESCLERSVEKPNVLILGDSHSNHLRHGLITSYPEINFIQASAAGCRVTIDPWHNETPLCAQFRARVFDELLIENPPDYVLISMFWGHDALDALKTTIDYMKDRNIPVILSGPIIRYEVAMPHALAMAKYRSDPSIVERARIPLTREVDVSFSAFATTHDLAYMSPYQSLCPDDKCVLESSDGEPALKDSNHLSRWGSSTAAKAFPSEMVLRSFETVKN